MRGMDRRLCVRGLLAAAFSLGLAGPAAARRVRRLTDPDLDAALVVEAASGKVIYARNNAAPRHPASLTKLMTLYLLFETLRAKKLALQTELLVSAHAASQPRRHLRLLVRQSSLGFMLDDPVVNMSRACPCTCSRPKSEAEKRVGRSITSTHCRRRYGTTCGGKGVAT